LIKSQKQLFLLANIGDFQTVNKVYADFFGSVKSGFPARAAYAVNALPLGAKVEIEAIAIQ